MSFNKILIALGSHMLVFVLGFGFGIYALPILTASDSPEKTVLDAAMSTAKYRANAVRDLSGSDYFHWGEGEFGINDRGISFTGELAPGPDYKLYLAPSFVEDEVSFEAIKQRSLVVGDIKSFEGFVLSLPEGLNIEDYNSVVVWCESFGEFITAAQYR